MTNRPTRSPLERLASKLSVNDETGCWEFGGAVNRDGYPVFWVEGRTVLAHRWLFQTVAGPLAADEEADHLCRNRRCCHPCHIEAVSSVENKLRITRPERRTTTYIHREIRLVELAS